MISRLILLASIVAVVGCVSTRDIQQQVIPMDTPSATSSAEPFLFTAGDGTVYLSWVSSQEKKSEFKFSKLVDNNWSAPLMIDSGTTWFVNWADYPMLTANGTTLMAAYLDKSGDDTYAYDVKVTMSPDEGTTWTDATVLHDDGKQAEHGFVSLVPFGENFFAAWLDGRNTVMEGMKNADHHAGHHGQMSLRGAILDNKGKKLNEWELDNRTCDCCQTGAAMTGAGPVVVYRDRSDDEIRDMYIVRYVNNEWTKPQPIHNDGWKITGCPVNGPRVVANGNTLAMAWYTAANGKPQVNVIFSNDGGETFDSPIRIADASIGRVDLEFIDDNSVFVTWMEGANIKGVRVDKDGSTDDPILIATSSEARSSGFPQLTRSGDRLIFAWTDGGEGKVKTAFLQIK